MSRDRRRFKRLTSYKRGDTSGHPVRQAGFETGGRLAAS
jgi:hypothetical protein